MKHFLVLGAFEDLQTGIYIVNSIEDAGHKVDFLDIRQICKELGSFKSQEEILTQLKNMNIKPDIVMILKGLEISKDTLIKIKEIYKDAKLVNWFFDVYLGDVPIYENKEYFDVLKMYDYYFCSLKGVNDKLKELGFSNAYYLDEACCPEANGEQYMNAYQKHKYGSDVSFIGSLGLSKMHKDRIRLLSLVANECFNLSIYGDVYVDWKYIPEELRRCHKRMSVINERHSMVIQSSLVNLGIDQDINIDMGFSARLFRILCAGGLLLNTNTKGLDKMFNINKKGESITKDLDLVVFYDDKDLCDKLDFLLEHRDIAEAIAKNGQKKALENHTFVHRIQEMTKIIGE